MVRRAVPPGERIRLAALAVLVLAHVLISVFGVVPGYLVIDEAIYDQTARAFVATGGFDLHTAYDDFPSPELVHEFLPVHGGRPVSQYPYLFPVLAAPLYALLGFRSLFVLNALAFLLAVFLCFRLAARLFGSRVLALDACLLFTLATFAWEYSQAAWPHALSLPLAIGSILLAVIARQSPLPDTAVRAALASGLIAGLAPGIRLDNALILPCCALIVFFGRPRRPRETGLVVVGSLPGLALLSATNHSKFGSWNPFSYGKPYGEFMAAQAATAVAVAVMVAGLAWVLARTPERSWLRARRIPLAWTVLLLALALMTAPAVRTEITREVRGAMELLVDIRVNDHFPVSGVRYSPGGGIIMLGAYKKALLQSLPWLPLLAVPLLAAVRRDRDAPALAILLVLPAVLVGYLVHARLYLFSGLCLNIRFLLPALPFLSILAAWSLRDLSRRWGISLTMAGLTASAVLTAAAYWILTRQLFPDMDDLEFPLLTLPLILAGLLMVLLTAGESLRGVTFLIPVRRAALGTLAVGLSWSCLVAFSYDYPHHRYRRTFNYVVGGEALQVVPPDSILFMYPQTDPFLRLSEAEHVRFGFPQYDQFKDFPRLVDGYLRRGKRVFGVFSYEIWGNLAAGPLGGYDLVPVWRAPVVYMAEVRAGH